MEQLSIEQFRQLKAKLNAAKNDIDEYMSIEEEIVSFDLSNIPFEEWNGMRIIGSIDFSETKANLDFRNVQFNNLCNFDNCNLRNIPVPELPLEWQEKCRNRELTYSDIIDNIDIFEGIPVRYYLKEDNEIPNLAKIVGNHLISDLIKEHFDVFSHIKNAEKFDLFNERINTNLPFEESFIKAVKNYARNGEYTRVRFHNENHEEYYQLPEWLNSMNFNIVPNYRTIEEIESHNIHNYVSRDGVDEFLEMMNIDYLKRFEEENHFLFKKARDRFEYTNYLEMIGQFVYTRLLDEDILRIKNNQNTYEEFNDRMAELINGLRLCNYFTDYPDYDFMEGDFRNKYPQLFVEKDSPEIIKQAFYKNRLTPSYINQHKEVIPYLVDKDLLSILVLKDNKYPLSSEENDRFHFAKNIINKFGNNVLLQLYAEYGNKLDTMKNYEEANTPFELENMIHDFFYDQIVNHNMNYDFLKNDKEFVAKHTSLFLDLTNVEGIPEEDKSFIEKSFHDRYFAFYTIYKYPQLIDVLKTKNINYAFGAKGIYKGNNASNYLFKDNPSYKFDEQQDLLKVLDKDTFLNLCARYGRYLEVRKNIDNTENKTPLQIQDEFDKQIIDLCRSGRINYFKKEAPEFLLKEEDLFLSEDAPKDLVDKFYSTINDQLNFTDLKKHPEWMPYLEGKAIDTALLRSSYKKDELKKYLKYFGDKAIKLGINRADTVQPMIEEENVDLMKKWYDKTNQKFIPDIVIMKNFELDNADKFLINGPVWSTLMRIKSMTEKEETKEALLKIAYTFGAFDNDNSGLKKAIDLFKSIPRELKNENIEIIDYFKEIESYEDKYLENNYLPKEFVDFKNLKDILIKEGFKYDESKSITENIYKQQEDGSYKLMFNQQACPKATEIIRENLERNLPCPVISPAKAHQLFGGFEMRYDKDFREFFLNNFEIINNDFDAPRYLSSIQKQFKDIKTVNSNRYLTWDLAVSYVQSNKYVDIEVGNEKVAEISSIAGYSQEEFNTLQKIYDYGKTRIFNSIPRVENTVGDYKYEFLKLNDPLAMAIGTLTDCCQELNNAAEMCMEHSMVSKEGRIFIVKDSENSIIAQSWTWRNKNTLCFDNIEIPDRAFHRKESAGIDRDVFANQVYEVYKKAAQEIIKKDQEKYKEALDKNEITKEDYDLLKLNRVTVGSGYNDIASALQKNAKIDTGVLSRPMYFNAPVELRKSLYTNDSQTQYILEQEENAKRANTIKTAPNLYHDDYDILDNSTFNEKNLLQLEKLELITKGPDADLKTEVSFYDNSNGYIPRISRNYGIQEENTKILLHPNFAIIYEDKGYEINIADILYNTKVGEEQRNIEDKVIMQINLGINQIADNREIDTRLLEGKAKDMFNRQKLVTDLINKERGVENGK